MEAIREHLCRQPSRVGDDIMASVLDLLGLDVPDRYGETARPDDPLRDCVAKFNRVRDTGSGQFDATRTP